MASVGTIKNIGQLHIFALSGAVAVLAVAAFATPALASDSFRARLPSAEKVVSDFGSDPIRGGAACQVVSNAMLILADPSDEWDQGNGPDAQRHQDLDRCKTEAAYASAIKSGAMSPGPIPQSPDPDFYAKTIKPIVKKIDTLAEDSEFQQTVAKRYLGGQDYAHWESYQKIQWASQKELAEQRNHVITKTLLIYLGLLTACLFFVWRAFRPWRYDAKTATLRVGGHTYAVHYDAGVVVESNASHSTQHIPGTQTIEVNQFGHQQVVRTTPGRSVTTLHETIHLIEKSGRERVMKLDDWGVSARAGHQVGGVFVVPKGRSEGEYLQIWNFTLDEAKRDKGTFLRTFGLRLFGFSMVTLAVMFLIVLYATISAMLDGETGIADESAVGIYLLGLFIGVVVAAVAQLIILALRQRRFAADIAAPIGRLAATDARESAALAAA